MKFHVKDLLIHVHTKNIPQVLLISMKLINMTVEEIFKDYSVVRTGILVALTTGNFFNIYDRALGASRLTAIALAHAFSLFAAVASSMNVSDGHINPAVTFGALVGDRVSVLRAVYYWIGQLLGAIVASALLRLATDGLVRH